MEPEDEMGGVDVRDAAAATPTAASAPRNLEASTAARELAEDSNPRPALRDDQWATLDETGGAPFGLGEWVVFEDEMFEGMGLGDALKGKLCQEKLVAQKLQELVDRQAVELKKLQAESDRWKAQFYNLYDSSAYPNDHFYCIRCAQEFLVGAVEACPHYCHDCELWKDGPDGCGCAMSESSSDASDSE